MSQAAYDVEEGSSVLLRCEDLLKAFYQNFQLLKFVYSSVAL